ncbi:tetratricopeptide repeat protein [Laceyella tengchongensis]
MHNEVNATNLTDEEMERVVEAYLRKHLPNHVEKLMCEIGVALLNEAATVGSLRMDSRTYFQEVAGDRWLRQAAELGNPQAMYELGWRMVCGEAFIAQDIDTGEKLLRQAAEAGETKAMWELGCLLLDGEYLPRDEQEGRLWYERAIAQGNTDSLYDWIIRLLNGEGIAPDPKQAEQLLRHLSATGMRAAKDMLKKILPPSE